MTNPTYYVMLRSKNKFLIPNFFASLIFGQSYFHSKTKIMFFFCISLT